MFVILTACTTKVNEGDISSNVTAISYNKVLEQGLQDESITLQDILYEKAIADSKIIFFTRHRALGVAYMGKHKDSWAFSRLTSLYDFQSESNPAPPYMAGGTEIVTPDGVKYYLAMGKIFNPNITKITLCNDTIHTIIKEKDGIIFWFQLIEDKDLLQSIKVYDKENKQLN